MANDIIPIHLNIPNTATLHQRNAIKMLFTGTAKIQQRHLVQSNRLLKQKLNSKDFWKYFSISLIRYLHFIALYSSFSYHYLGLDATKPVFGGLRTTEAQTSLRICAV